MTRFVAILFLALMTPAWGIASIYVIFFGNQLLGFFSIFCWAFVNYYLFSAAIKERETQGGGVNSPIVTPEKIVIIKKRDDKEIERREANSKHL